MICHGNLVPFHPTSRQRPFSPTHSSNCQPHWCVYSFQPSPARHFSLLSSLLPASQQLGPAVMRGPCGCSSSVLVNSSWAHVLERCSSDVSSGRPRTSSLRMAVWNVTIYCFDLYTLSPRGRTSVKYSTNLMKLYVIQGYIATVNV